MMKRVLALVALGCCSLSGGCAHHHEDDHEDKAVHAAGHSHSGMEWYHGRLEYNDEAVMEWVPPQITRALDHHHDHANCPCHDPSTKGFHFATDHNPALASVSKAGSPSIAIPGCCSVHN